ncbi:glycosyl transferase family 2 [Nanobdella aerobiophila]|uniref:Glycosyl transferase family 2 n=1 Tax=Nanobdella aerobiophila TaxID=2586965 RepID=A0A915SYA2_9ARCH|nr:glycosyltransferase family 2 protein [Nanobdella aerobiophila]BBL45650.1 glycosyl transferase family 2 [Nanobdella aerobiophila]
MLFLKLFGYILPIIISIFVIYILVGIYRYNKNYINLDSHNFDKNKIFILVPLYNEKLENFKLQINLYKKYNILYILNGSLEPYKSILEENNIRYIYIDEKNKKKAVWTGLDYIKKFNPEYILLLDSDTIITDKDIIEGLNYIEKFNISALSFNILYYGNNIYNDLISLINQTFIYINKGFTGNNRCHFLYGQCILGKFGDIYDAYKLISEKYINKKLGDDRLLASILINNNKKIFYLDNNYIITEGINSFNELIKKFTRYMRSLIIISIIDIKERYIFKKSIFYYLYLFISFLPLVLYIYNFYTILGFILSSKHLSIYIVKGLFYKILYINIVSDIRFLYNLIFYKNWISHLFNYPHIFVHLLYILFKYFVISFYMISIYAIYIKYIHKKSPILLYMLFSFIYPFILFYSLFTFFKDDWLTR